MFVVVFPKGLPAVIFHYLQYSPPIPAQTLLQHSFISPLSRSQDVLTLINVVLCNSYQLIGHFQTNLDSCHATERYTWTSCSLFFIAVNTCLDCASLFQETFTSSLKQLISYGTHVSCSNLNTFTYYT
jgi:hypothetical protein